MFAVVDEPFLERDWTQVVSPPSRGTAGPADVARSLLRLLGLLFLALRLLLLGRR
jgi:hypothetical protein